MSDTLLTKNQPWDRREGEPMRWYARFERFRLAGPTRSLLGVYKRERSAAGRGTAGKRMINAIPPTWSEAAAKWEWRERAEAWDAAELEREAIAHQQWQRRARKRRLRLLDALGRKLKQAVAQSSVEGVPVNVLAGAVKQASEAERAEFAASQDESDASLLPQMVNGFIITRRERSSPITGFEIEDAPIEHRPQNQIDRP